MQSYSVRRMRAERQHLFRFIIALAVICLLLSAVCGALWKAFDGSERSPLIFTGVFLLLSLFLMGKYLVESDENRLIKKTVFGRALVIYGDKKHTYGWEFDEKHGSRQLMDEIDEEALHMQYECSGFALTPNWAVLYASPPASGKNTIYSLPVRKRWIKRIRWEQAGKEENSGFTVLIEVPWNASPYRIHACEQADIQALRAWSAAQEKQQ